MLFRRGRKWGGRLRVCFARFRLIGELGLGLGLVGGGGGEEGASFLTRNRWVF